MNYRIPSLPFISGSYLVTVAVINHNDTETFDYRDRVVEFEMYPGTSDELYGMWNLGGSWALDSEQPPIDESLDSFTIANIDDDATHEEEPLQSEVSSILQPYDKEIVA